MDNSKFSKIALIISIVALLVSVAVIVASLIGHKSLGGEKSAASSGVVLDSSGNISIAYVNLDSLLLEYKYSIKLNEDLLTEQAKAKANLEG